MSKYTISESFAARISDVWKLVTDVANYSWRSTISRCDLIDEKHFIEYAKDGTKTQFYISDSEYLRFWACDFQNEKISGHFVADFTLSGNKSIVSLTTRMQAKTSRIFGAFNNIHFMQEQKRFFKDLKRTLGE